MALLLCLISTFATGTEQLTNLEMILANCTPSTTNGRQFDNFQKSHPSNNHTLSRITTNIRISSPATSLKLEKLLSDSCSYRKPQWVVEGMRRECKCYGVSGNCNMTKCWLKLPPFRSVAENLRSSYDLAIKLISVESQNSLGVGPLASKAAVLAGTKSNKKRHSAQQQHQQLNEAGLSTDSSSANVDDLSSRSTYPQPIVNAVTFGKEKSSVNIIGSRSQRGSKRHTIGLEDPLHEPDQKSQSRASSRVAPGSSPSGVSSEIAWSTSQQLPPAEQGRSNSRIPFENFNSKLISKNITTLVKRRPVARSIAHSQAQYIMPNKFDLLYNQDSPDFCSPSETYDIKGTRGRLCSENPNANNFCQTLCCGRGYRTEVHEEKYNCDCQFQYCCKLECKTCSRRKIIHKCS